MASSLERARQGKLVVLLSARVSATNVGRLMAMESDDEGHGGGGADAAAGALCCSRRCGSSAAETTRSPWPGAAAETTGAAAAAAAETEMALGLFSPRATRSKQGSADPRIEGPLPAPHRPCTPGRSPIEFGFDCFRSSVPGGRVIQAEWTDMVGGPFC